MARRLFFVSEIRREQAVISGDDAQHLTRVLRVEPGFLFELSDNSSLYLAEVETARKSEVVFRVKEKLPPPPPPLDVTIYPAIFKFDHFEWMLEKATELGAARIVPIIAERTEQGLDRAAQKRVERWRKIVLEASQQCRRMILPKVDDPISFTKALAQADPRKLFLDEAAPNTSPLKPSPTHASILIGPEGGWPARERDQAIAAGWTPVSLGPRILRAETATIAALAIMGQGI